MRLGRTHIIAAAFAVIALACVRRLPVDGARCPCPVGYCCVDGRCVPGDACGAPKATRLAYGDEMVVGFTASGRYLVTVGAPSTTPIGPQGLVLIRDLETMGEPMRSGHVAVRDEISLSRAADSVTGPDFRWTPTQRFQPRNELETVSPDGRIIVDLAIQPDGNIEAIVYTDNPSASATVRRVSLTSLGGPVVFSPDSSMAFMIDADTIAGTTRLLRVATAGEAPAETFAASGISSLVDSDLGQTPFGPDGTLIFGSTEGIWAWHPGEAAPAKLVTNAPNATEGALIVGALGDSLFVRVPPWEPGHADRMLERVSISTGKLDVLYARDLMTMVPAPDGVAALAMIWNGGKPKWELFDLRSGTTIGEMPGSRFDYHFTSDARWIYGVYPQTDGHDELWLGDTVVVDARTGAPRTLAAHAVADEPLAVDEGHVAFVRIGKDMKYADLFMNAAPVVGRGDLVVSTIAATSDFVAATGVDEYIAVHGRRVAFSRHGQNEADGVYVIDVPEAPP